MKGHFGQRQIILNSHVDVLELMRCLKQQLVVNEVETFYDTVEMSLQTCFQVST